MQIETKRIVVLSDFTDDEVEFLFQVGNYGTYIAMHVAEGEPHLADKRKQMCEFFLTLYQQLESIRRPVDDQ